MKQNNCCRNTRGEYNEYNENFIKTEAKKTGCCKLSTFDWMKNLHSLEKIEETDLVEVRFKNGRKEILKNINGLRLEQGDLVVCESSPGYDVGIVSLVGIMVTLQIKQKGISNADENAKKIYRKAKPADIEKWEEVVGIEVVAMFKAREIALELGLEMKICDVEFQADNTKAIFYYTAEGRVDFRELIKKYAENFKVRIEMKQIGARQEASKLGGIGSCGRELCCSTWHTNFSSVNTIAAKQQQIAPNPLKLAGQCGKLKCCLNYELDCYNEALKSFPDTSIKLKTKKGDASFQKLDVHKKALWYTYDNEPYIFLELELEYVKKIISDNNKGILTEELIPIEKIDNSEEMLSFENVVGQDSLTRFDSNNEDKKRPKNKKKKKKPFNKNNNTNEV